MSTTQQATKIKMETIMLPSFVASQVILIGWDEDRYGDNQPGWGVDYYGTAYESVAEQRNECLLRAEFIARAALAVRLPNNEWILGTVRG